jgi:hypothetical protein
MTKKRMLRAAARVTVVGALAGLFGTAPLGSPAAAAPSAHDEADGVEVYAGDVYEIVVSTLRHPDAETAADEPLFSDSGVRLESSPGDVVTWGEWSAASARSVATVVGPSRDPRSRFRLQLSGLVPGGLYSVFWGTLGPDSEQPLCPSVERTLPLDRVGGKRGPAPNAFVADQAGQAAFTGQADHDLFAASQVFLSIVWHFSGETHYPFPNKGEFLTQVPPGEQCRSSFGQDAMRHLLVLQKW